MKIYHSAKAFSLFKRIPNPRSTNSPNTNNYIIMSVEHVVREMKCMLS